MTNKIKPISPDEVVEQKIKSMPDAVIEIWNTAIAKRWTGLGTVTIRQDAIVDELKVLTNGNRNAVLTNGWLDIEELYRAQGWKVNYDKPGYNESYGAFFEFSKRSRG